MGSQNERSTQPPRWPKRCGCGRSFDREAWHKLHLVGTWRIEGRALELRTCECTSTISMPLALVSND